jgi:hypothetical protein
MNRILLVSRDVVWSLELARGWARDDAVQVVLLDGAVASARPGHSDHDAVAAAVDAGVVVAAHAAAAGRRAMGPGELADGVKLVDLDEIADVISDTTGQVIWL